MAAGTRPLTLGEILDRTVQLYRRNFLLLAGIAVPAAALIMVISGIAVIFLSSHTIGLAQAGQGGQVSPQVYQEMLRIGLAACLFFVVGMPIILGVLSIALAAMTFAATQLNRGETVSIQSAYSFAFQRFWRFVGVLFLQALFAWVIPYMAMGAVIVVGAILIALIAHPGAGSQMAPLFVVLLVLLILVWLVVSILIWLRLSLAFPASVAEDQKAWPSLKRSNHLSRNSRGRIFVMFLLVFVLSIVASLALTLPTDIVIGIMTRKSFGPNHLPASFVTFTQIANLAAGFLVRVFVMPVYATALVLFYVDQRTRMEGYDIEQLMVQAGWSNLEAPPPAFAQPPLAFAQPLASPAEAVAPEFPPVIPKASADLENPENPENRENIDR